MPAKRKRSAKKAASDSMYELKITLREIEPSIWRRIIIPATASLGELHYILQAAMGWTNSHLHQFRIGDVDYSDPQFELENADDEFAVILSAVAPRPKARFTYIYDFGDGWEHEVVVEKILARETGNAHPACVAGERSCPPEDCGGPWGYADLLEAIRDPDREEHADMLEWVGEEFDPDRFDLNEVNEELKERRTALR